MFRDYQNYEVFADGKIWSKVRNKFLKPTTKKNGYQRVCLYDNEGKKNYQFVHRVCWMAVNGVWEIPKYYDIHHCDEVKTNNHISNLLLCTRKENLNFGTRNSRAAKALSKRVGAFKNDELVMVFSSTNEAERQGYKHSAVSQCCNGKRKTHKGYVWKYLDE